MRLVGTNDLFEMGGLRRWRPVAFLTMTVAALSLAGIWPLSGFWSKDEILVATASTTHLGEPGRTILYLLALATVFLTAFYMFRVIFLTFSVILATVVGQGLTLPKLIDLLDLEDDSRTAEKEEIKARIHAAEAALARLEELANEEWVREDTAERLRRLYDFRSSRFRAQYQEDDDGSIEQRSTDYQRLLRELIEAERAAVRTLRRERRISDDVMRRVERDLDLEEARLE